MAEYKNFEALCEYFQEKFEYYKAESEKQVCGGYVFDEKMQFAAIVAKHFLDKVKEAPAADVVEVIKCKDCKNWGGITFGNVCSRWSAPLSGTKNCTKPDDFCSYGERKGDENAENI